MRSQKPKLWQITLSLHTENMFRFNIAHYTISSFAHHRLSAGESTMHVIMRLAAMLALGIMLR